jgi:hypothetical protein
MFSESIDRDAAVSILEHLEASSAFMPVAHLRGLGGAIARVPAEMAALAHRDRLILSNVAALYQPPIRRKNIRPGSRTIPATSGEPPVLIPDSSERTGRGGSARLTPARPGND